MRWIGTLFCKLNIGILSLLSTLALLRLVAFAIAIAFSIVHSLE